ncbi:MAG: methyltransferase domain-containing protein [Patescibacteria group bacterium]
MKPKVLLCQPTPTESSPQKNSPLSIIYTGAAAEKAGYEVEYWDERWDSKEKLLELIKWSDVVGVSSFTGIQLKYAAEILKLAKENNKTTIFGGVHASLMPEQCIKEDFIDYVAVGEGEITLPSFLAFFQDRNIIPKGIVGRDVKYIPAGKLDAVDFVCPITDKTLRLFKLANQTSDIMFPSSRGCPYSCGFCVNSTDKDKKYRMLDLQLWAQWLDVLLSHMQIKWIQIGDDYLGRESRILEVGKILKERNIKWHPSFRADNFKVNGPEFARKLSELGVTDIAMGVETGSERLMKFINKAETKEDILHAAKCLSENSNIRPRYYLIIGFPTETLAERNETFAFADQLYEIHKGNCNIPIYNFTPFPGITLHSVAVAHGMRVPERMSEWENFTVSNSGSNEMQSVYHIAGFHFHQKPGSKTDINFPGMRRWLVKPFEKLCDIRWRKRYFKYFGVEKFILEFLLKYCRVKPKDNIAKQNKAEGNRFGGERLDSKSNLSRNNLVEHLARYNLVSGNPESTVLDIGCGSGHGSHELSKKFKKIYGVDVSAEAISYAKENWSAPNVEFSCGSGTGIPFADNFFDVAAAFEVFEHVQDWRKFLSEIKRVVRNDGLVYISTPNREIYSPGTAAGQKPNNPYHVFEMAVDEFKSALSEFFVIEKFYGQSTPVYNDRWFWKILNPVLLGLRHLNIISYKTSNTIKLKIINRIKPVLEPSDIVFYQDDNNIKKSRFMVAVCRAKK